MPRWHQRTDDVRRHRGVAASRDRRWHPCWSWRHACARLEPARTGYRSGVDQDWGCGSSARIVPSRRPAPRRWDKSSRWSPPAMLTTARRCAGLRADKAMAAAPPAETPTTIWRVPSASGRLAIASRAACSSPASAERCSTSLGSRQDTGPGTGPVERPNPRRRTTAASHPRFASSFATAICRRGTMPRMLAELEVSAVRNQGDRQRALQVRAPHEKALQTCVLAADVGIEEAILLDERTRCGARILGRTIPIGRAAHTFPSIGEANA